QREAQVLATLNHPNIAQIYGLEESEGVCCIVMELVDGETLPWNEFHARACGSAPSGLCDVLALQSEVAEPIAREIEIKLTPQEQAPLPLLARWIPKRTKHSSKAVTIGPSEAPTR